MLHSHTSFTRKTHRLVTGLLLTLLATASPSYIISPALADEKDLARLIREADKVVGKRTIRAKRSKGQWNALSGPDFSGNWSGTYALAKSNCSAKINSFNFRHSLLQSGATASLNTSHAGGFYGTSRDRGRRLEFAKTVTLTNGAVCSIAVVYKDITKDRRATNTAYGESCNGCTWVWAARARR